MHGFMSLESQAEAYNETFRNSVEVEIMKSFLSKNPLIGRHFDRKMNSQPSDEDIFFSNSCEFNEDDTEKEGMSVYSGVHEMHRKSLNATLLINGYLKN